MTVASKNGMTAVRYQLNPDFILSLDGPRLGGPSSRWSLGAALERELTACRDRMLALAEAGHPGWFEGARAERFFTREGDALRMHDALFFDSCPDLLEEPLHLRCTRRSDGRYLKIPLERQAFPALRTLLPRLASGNLEWDVDEPANPALVAAMTMLVDYRVAVRCAPPPAPAQRDDFRVTFIGHSCLLLETPSTRVLVDPLFNYSQQRAMDLLPMLREKIDAIVVSHPHWDHFHVDSMLLLSRDTPVYVPRADSPSSVVNVDAARLARSFGFRDVRPRSHWQCAGIGDIDFLPLPFYGEGYGPEVGIDAMAYAFRLGGKTVAGFVDACSDHFGEMDIVARTLHGVWGDVDFFFAPCTNFHWPLHAYLRRPFHMSRDTEQFTGSPQDCLRWARLLRARRLIPYAAFRLDDRSLEPRSERQRSTLDDMADLAAREGRELTLMKVRTSLRWKAGEAEQTDSWDSS